MWLNPDHPNALAHIRHLAQQHDGASACYDLRHEDHGNESRTALWDWILVFMPCQRFWSRFYLLSDLHRAAAVRLGSA